MGKSPRTGKTTGVPEESVIIDLANPDVAAAAEPEEADIARRAHEIYESRGRNDRSDLDDWLQAERELQKHEVRPSTGEGGAGAAVVHRSATREPNPEGT